MKVRMMGAWFAGRVVDVVMSAGGLLHLPDNQVANNSCFMCVDVVGPDVKRCQPGDYIAFKKCEHFQTRDGHRITVAQDEDVIFVAGDIDESLLKFHGELVEDQHASGDGVRVAEAQA